MTSDQADLRPVVGKPWARHEFQITHQTMQLSTIIIPMRQGSDTSPLSRHAFDSL
jgi:hypothetical protein